MIGCTRRAVVLAAVGLVLAACSPREVVQPAPDPTPPAPTPATEPSPPLPEDPAAGGRAAELPEPLTEVAGTLWEGRIVVAGGLDAGGRAVAGVHLYDPATDAWSRGPDLPVALHHTALATLGQRVYVVGGYGVRLGAWMAEAEVWSLGPGEEAWRLEPALAMPRGALAVASTGSRLVAVGGVGPGQRVLTSTEVLAAGAAAWEPGAELAIAREHLAATAVGEEVYAIAGRAGGFDTNRASVEVLRQGVWEEAPSLTFSRGGIGGATVHGVPCVAGGEETIGTIGSIECLIEGAWEVIGRLEVARHGLVVVSLDGALHVIGGGPQPGLTVSGVHEVIPVPPP